MAAHGLIAPYRRKPADDAHGELAKACASDRRRSIGTAEYRAPVCACHSAVLAGSLGLPDRDFSVFLNAALCMEFPSGVS